MSIPMRSFLHKTMCTYSVLPADYNCRFRHATNVADCDRFVDVIREMSTNLMIFVDLHKTLFDRNYFLEFTWNSWCAIVCRPTDNRRKHTQTHSTHSNFSNARMKSTNIVVLELIYENTAICPIRRVLYRSRWAYVATTLQHLWDLIWIYLLHCILCCTRWDDHSK
jgi:hypothetical protein